MHPFLSSIFCCALLTGGCTLDVQLGHLPDTVAELPSEPSAQCLLLSSVHIDFGTVTAGQERGRTLTITNQCDREVVLSGIDLSGDGAFTLDWEATEQGIQPRTVHALQPAESLDLNLLFRPIHQAVSRGQLTVHALFELPSIALLGNPTGPCLELETSELNLGCTIVGTTNWRSMAIRNCGQTETTVESLTWSTDSATAFTVGMVELPATLAPGEERTITVGYSPSSDGDQVAPMWESAALHIDVLGYKSPHALNVRGFGKKLSCEGMRIVLVWVTPGDPDPKDRGPEAGSDMDLHLLHPFAVDFFDIPFDTYWYNASPQWGLLESTLDDPILSIDDYDSLGPESIVLPLPEDGHTYTVGVHYWSDHAYGPSRAQVQIIVFGNLVYESPLIELVNGELWEVGTIGWPNGDIEAFKRDNGKPVIHTDYKPPCEVISCGK